MFTGIIEDIGEVVNLTKEGTNLHISVKSKLTTELKIDQSVAHDGACLTVVSTDKDVFTVTAINETLKKTTLGELKIGSLVNLERAMKLGDRLDGHLVQGHIDQTAICIDKKDENGSWHYTFKYDTSAGNVTIEKGSVTINGVSLTVLDSREDTFSVAIIPYTFNNTNFKEIKYWDQVNIEFDLVGKFLKRLMK